MGKRGGAVEYTSDDYRTLTMELLDMRQDTYIKYWLHIYVVGQMFSCIVELKNHTPLHTVPLQVQY